MSNYPTSLDDDSSLPAINDNLTENGGEAINATRDAIFQIEGALGLNIAGSMPSLSARLGVFINPDGTPKASVLTSLGLITLPITNSQIINNAGIPESKLTLDYSTINLFNYIQNLDTLVDSALGWISISGVKLEPHLAGFIYRHNLFQIDVAGSSTQYLNNKFRLFRNNSDAYQLINDINNELLFHQWADGSNFGIINNVFTNNGSTYPSNYSHTASGIFLNTGGFAVVPQTAKDLQSFADFVDSTSILTLGTRVQNLYANGISKNSRSSSLTADGYGQALVPVTPAIAYLRGAGNNSIPFDDISIGDDIIELKPSSTVMSNNTFDEQFALVRPGDIIRINYASDGYNIEIPFIISEKKYIQGGGNKIYLVRIAGKNIVYAPHATARIDKDLLNNNKYGVLATAGVNSPSGSMPSLIVGHPRGAQCLGVDFSPDQFNETHYLLYLALYNTGNPLDGYTFLPAIDITGNQGITPGSYTLDSIVESTNIAFRQPGFNYRFIAFSYQGEFGIMLSDSYNNVSFSVVSAVVDASGMYSQSATQLNFPNNVIDIFPLAGATALDPLGFGPNGAGLASPPFMTSYGSAESASNPTKLFTPLRRNNYYINGTERERLSLDISQAQDIFGDGYWVSTIDGYTANSGPPGHVVVTYNIPLDLSASGLKAGKTIVVQPLGSNFGLVNYGRFIIQSITFTCCPPVQTQITVYDAVHATGASPYPIASVGSKVAIYFNSDSVSFNTETATDFSLPIAIAPNTIVSFKRFFEAYVDSNGKTFTHERGRFSLGTGPSGSVTVNGTIIYNNLSLTNVMDITNISSKLRGYQFGSVNKITLNITSYNSLSGIYTGYLASYNGTDFTRRGPLTSGKIGSITRFYDETNVDYIDIIFSITSAVSDFTNQYIDIQLFPTLSLDEEIMLIATCEVNDNNILKLKDHRQFGNTSEEQFTTSALDFIAFPQKVLNFNGIIRGFDLLNNGSLTIPSQYGTAGLISLNGGLALTDGKFNFINDQIITIPAIQEVYNSIIYSINFALCINSIGELVTIVLTDYDSSIGTPNSALRVITVKNLVSSTTYKVDSTTFSNLLNNRKDLTVLYIVSSKVSGTGNSATTNLILHDVRRYINDSDSSISAVLTNDNSQGNFKDFIAATKWIKFNNEFQNELIVKGIFNIVTDPELNFSLNIKGGASTSSLIFGIAITASNTSFDNLIITFSAPTIASNINFDNCTIYFNSTSQLTNVTFNNCTVYVNGTMDVTSVTSIKSIFNVSVTKGFVLNSNILFENCTFNYSVNPIGIGSYNTFNLINTTSGMMYSGVNSSLVNIKIYNCIFKNTVADHFPFISFQLTNNNSIIENIIINNNQFISQLASNDIRAIVSFNSTVVSAPSGSTYPKFPKLVNVNIENNITNYDQMIAITTDRAAGLSIIGSMLACTNVNIYNNTCGTIGFITAGDGVSNLDNSNNSGLIRNKLEGLTIESNSCKLITNLDSIGDYISFRSTFFPVENTNYVNVNTGACSIINNSTSWIQVGSSSYIGTSPNDGIIMSGNHISPSNPIFLNNFTDTLGSNITPFNAAILLRRDSDADGYTQNIICNNIIIQKPVLETNGTYTTYLYDAGIVNFNNTQIYGNTINSVLNSSTAPMIFLWSTGIANVKNNILIRGNNDIQAYIVGQSGATNTAVITENIFDSQFVDVALTNNNAGLNIPDKWSFYKNKNQIQYAVIPFSGLSPGASNLISSDAGMEVRNAYVYTSITSVSPGTTQEIYTYDIPLDSFLPESTKIISSKIGLYFSNPGGFVIDTGGLNDIAIAFKSMPIVKTNYTAGLNSILDCKNSFSTFTDSQQIFYSFNSAPLLASLSANTIYASLNLSNNNNYSTTKDNALMAQVTLRWKFSTWGGTGVFIISPLVVQYTW